jgi:hypothetical protein
MNESGDHGHKSVTLLAIGLLIFTLFQLVTIVGDRVTLTKAKLQVDNNIAEADKALADGAKMLDKLNDVAIATQKLANAGNSNAKEIVGQLNKAGIRINPDFKKPAPGAAPGAPAVTPPPAAPEAK